MSKARDIFNALSGDWTVERQITPGGVFNGIASFKEIEAGVLQYQEEGELTLDNGAVLKPQKRYQWRLEGDEIVIYFDDGDTKGQRFHALDFTSDSSARAEHPCAPDFYKTAYEFISSNSFTVQHDVNGPKKDYTSMSTYTRS